MIKSTIIISMVNTHKTISKKMTNHILNGKKKPSLTHLSRLSRIWRNHIIFRIRPMWMRT
jgi:hypothetical protein